MFDEKPPKTFEAPGNVPTEPADMFAGIKDESDDSSGRLPDALSSGLLKKKESSMSVMPDVSGGNQSGMTMQATGTSGFVKAFIGLAIIVVVAGLGAGGWWLYKTAQDSSVPATVQQQNETESPVITESPVVTTSPEPEQPATVFASSSTRTNNDSILFGTMIDTDKDGINDVQEREIGTDPVKSDTDEDQLNDGDEMFIWKTNPLKADTDGDSYLDGAEIKNGFTPLGPGRLVPTTSTTTTVKTSSTIQ